MNEHETEEKIKKLEAKVKMLKGRTNTLVWLIFLFSLFSLFGAIATIFIFRLWLSVSLPDTVWNCWIGIAVFITFASFAIWIYWSIKDWINREQTQQLCTTCGKKIETDAMFCKYCGKQQRD